MDELHCVVTTPTHSLFSGVVASLRIPGSDGDYGVLPGHEMLVATNRNGGILTLNIDAEGKEQKQFILYEGAAQVFNNIVTVLCRFGKDVTEIDIADVNKSRDRVNERLEKLEAGTPTKQDQAEIDTSHVRLEWYQMQIDYAQEHGIGA